MEEGKKFKKITGFMNPGKVVNLLSDNVIRAEVKMVELYVELNQPFAAHDQFNKVVKKVFWDSEIAKKYQCMYLEMEELTLAEKIKISKIKVSLIYFIFFFALVILNRIEQQILVCLFSYLTKCKNMLILSQI